MPGIEVLPGVSALVWQVPSLPKIHIRDCYSGSEPFAHHVQQSDAALAL